MVKVPVAPSAEMAPPPVAGVNCAGLTVMAGLVLAVLLPSSRSVAVRVKLPVVLNETIRLVVPRARAVVGRQGGGSITGAEAHGVADRVDQVPVSIHGVDRDVESRARDLGAGRAGLAAGGARRGGFAGHQQLQFA